MKSIATGSGKKRLGRTPLQSISTAICVAVSALAAQPLLATSPPEFDITGQTISFGFKDWYQVQNASTYNTLCEGFADCTVPAGNYIVINHTTGERFDNIRVMDATTPPTGEGVIVYPAQGWYQVQDATTFESICEGGTSCAVSPGTYIVINHTTGVRTEQVVSGNIPVEPPDLVNRVSVLGNNILMPNIGWYQVQNKADYSSICEGVTECTVADGIYIVVNHTTGKREEVIVGTSVTGDNAIELLNQAFEVFMFNAYNERIFSGFNTDNLTQLTVNPDGLSGSGTYSCSNGGSAELLREDEVNSPEYVSEYWEYDNCLIGVESRNGEVYRFAIPAKTSSYTYRFRNYETEIQPTGALQVSGEFVGLFADAENLSTSWQNIMRTTNEPVDYQTTIDGRSLKVLDSSTFYRQLRPFEDARNEYSQVMEGSFTLVPTSTTAVFNVSSNMFGALATESSAVQLQAGAMRITSESDGGYVELSPDTGDINTVVVRISANTGEAPQETFYRWTDLPFYDLFLD